MARAHRCVSVSYRRLRHIVIDPCQQRAWIAQQREMVMEMEMAVVMMVEVERGVEVDMTVVMEMAMA